MDMKTGKENRAHAVFNINAQATKHIKQMQTAVLYTAFEVKVSDSQNVCFFGISFFIYIYKLKLYQVYGTKQYLLY